MNRILPETVCEAYKVGRFTPTQQTWAIEVGGDKCACGLSAVYSTQVENGYEKIHTIVNNVHDGEPWNIIEESLNLSHGYALGFVLGFDGSNLNDMYDKEHVDTEDWKQGYADGKDSWKLVKGLAMSS